MTRAIPECSAETAVLGPLHIKRPEQPSTASASGWGFDPH